MTDQQAPERIWFYADPIAGWLGAAKSFTTPDGVSPKPYVPLDLLEAAEKQRDELAEQNKQLGDMYHKRGNDITWTKRQLKKAEAERDQALASVGAVIENLRHHLVMKTGLSQESLSVVGQACRALNPDATAALNEMLVDAWGEGWVAGRSGVRADRNPHRKGTNE